MFGPGKTGQLGMVEDGSSDQLASFQGNHMIVTTNRAFTEWGELFPNATCVVPLVDRLVHHCEIVQIEGDSYRLKEARERSGA